ncbi:hypothetical protein EI94DRAFT_1749480, partial [Lactarius quietus]
MVQYSKVISHSSHWVLRISGEEPSLPQPCFLAPCAFCWPRINFLVHAVWPLQENLLALRDPALLLRCQYVNTSVISERSSALRGHGDNFYDIATRYLFGSINTVSVTRLHLLLVFGSPVNTFRFCGATILRHTTRDRYCATSGDVISLPKNTRQDTRAIHGDPSLHGALSLLTNCSFILPKKKGYACCTAVEPTNLFRHMLGFW